MLRLAAAVLTGLLSLSLARPAAAAEVAAGPPVPGRNFSIARPAIAMIWIAPGTLTMRNPHGAGDDTEVTLTRGYWLGRTEVTQAQWQAMSETADGSQQLFIATPSFHRGTDRPVDRISWDMAHAFCAKLTEMERAAGRLPAGYHYTLPTEAQWEYACRAGTTGKYAGDLSAMAWYAENSGGETHPVAHKQPNAWGLYDMHGNAGEWCADWYGSYPGGTAVDPAGPPTGVYRVIRGGGGASSAGGCRSAIRGWGLAALGSLHSGFRVALAPQTVAPKNAPPAPPPAHP